MNNYNLGKDSDIVVGTQKNFCENQKNVIPGTKEIHVEYLTSDLQQWYRCGFDNEQNVVPIPKFYMPLI